MTSSSSSDDCRVPADGARRGLLRDRGEVSTRSSGGLRGGAVDSASSPRRRPWWWRSTTCSGSMLRRRVLYSSLRGGSVTIGSGCSSPRLPDGGRRADDLLSALGDSPARRIHIGPLTLAATHQLLRDRLGCALPRPTLVRIQQAAGGNPFFAQEIARELGSGRICGPRSRCPCRETFARSSAAASSGSRDHASRAPTRRRPVAADADAHRRLAQGQHGGVGSSSSFWTVGVAFTHLYASAVYEAATPEERRETHRELAMRLEDVERARHRARDRGSG